MSQDENVYRINPKRDRAEAERLQAEYDHKVLKQAEALLEYFVNAQSKTLTPEQSLKYICLCKATFEIAATLAEIMIKTGPINDQTH